ncbi:MAG: hypothetical protein ACKV22_03080 [Bryobacteraceae bacterium]
MKRASRCSDRARLFRGGASYDRHDYRNNFSLLRFDPDERTVVRRPWEFDPRGPKWEEKKPQEYSLRLEPVSLFAQPKADPSKYLDWLRTETRFVELQELKVGPEKTPPAEMDQLYIRLMTDAPLLGTGGVEAGESVPLDRALDQTRR